MEAQIRLVLDNAASTVPAGPPPDVIEFEGVVRRRRRAFGGVSIGVATAFSGVVVGYGLLHGHPNIDSVVTPVTQAPVHSVDNVVPAVTSLSCKSKATVTATWEASGPSGRSPRQVGNHFVNAREGEHLVVGAFRGKFATVFVLRKNASARALLTLRLNKERWYPYTTKGCPNEPVHTWQ